MLTHHLKTKYENNLILKQLQQQQHLNVSIILLGRCSFCSQQTIHLNQKNVATMLKIK